MDTKTLVNIQHRFGMTHGRKGIAETQSTNGSSGRPASNRFPIDDRRRRGMEIMILFPALGCQLGEPHTNRRIRLHTERVHTNSG